MTSSDVRRENGIKNALRAVEEGASVRVASRDWEVPRTTLRRRIQGAQSSREAKESKQRLSRRQEDLVQWILSEEKAGRPPTRREIVAFAQYIVGLGNNDTTLGHNWVYRFLSRNPDVKMKLSRGIAAVRTLNSTEERFRDFYERLDREIKTKAVGSSRIYNMDETGLAEGETRAGKVLGSSLTSRSTRTKGSPGEWVSIVECVSAVGRRIDLLVIFTGQQFQGQWFPDSFPDWAYGCSSTGWSNGDLAARWLKTVFLPQTAPEIASLWRILVIDGSTCHTTLDFMYTAWKHRVQLLFLPSHSSHITQPLDTGVFSPLKEYYRQQLAGFVDFDYTAPYQKQRFLREYKVAAEKAFTKENIRAGFRASGIYPTNLERPLSEAIKPTANQVPPRTPEREIEETDTAWWTPRDSREIRAQEKLVQGRLSSVNRGVRSLAAKAGRALDHKNTSLAALRAENKYLKAKLAAQRPRGRKTVKMDPNDVFASVENIVKAKDAAKKSAQRIEQRQNADTITVATEDAQKDAGEILRQMQLD